MSTHCRVGWHTIVNFIIHLQPFSPTCLSVYLSYSGGPDHGKHGAPPLGSPAGRLPEPHHPAGHAADAPRVPARLRPWAQGQHRIPTVAQLVCPDRQGKDGKGFTRCVLGFGDRQTADLAYSSWVVFGFDRIVFFGCCYYAALNVETNISVSHTWWFGELESH